MEKNNTPNLNKMLIIIVAFQLITICMLITFILLIKTTNTRYFIKYDRPISSNEQLMKTEQKDLSIKQNLNAIYNDVRIKDYVNTNPSILKKVEIKDIKEVKVDSSRYAYRITLKNISSRDLYNVLIILDCYDNAGNIIADNGNGLKKLAVNSEYTFEIPIIKKDSYTWKLAQIQLD